MTAANGSPSLAALGLRFLRLGATAWGGPVVQIGALHDEFVGESVGESVERPARIDEARFRRALAVYQALPGPEATEMCIWIGTVLRGRLGGLLAGLAFVLPGFLLMLLASWLLFALDPWPPALQAAFTGMQAAVVAVVLRAAWRLFGVATQRNAWLHCIAVASALGACAGVPFWATLVGGGLVAACRHHPTRAAFATFAWLTVGALFHTTGATDLTPATPLALAVPTAGELLGTGLRAGLLTFGGAYTAIPFLQADAVGPTGWMTQAQFLSGLAVGGVIPAPMVIVGTWVGWAGGGFTGALLVTLGIFLPAFVLPLLLHERLERTVRNPGMHAFLDGVTAAVVGLVAAVAIALAATQGSPLQAGIAIGVLLAMGLVRHRLTIMPVMAVAALVGVLAG